MKKLELSGLLHYYKAPDEVHDQLEDARREGSKRGWWSTYKLAEWFKPYVGLEHDAETVCNFEAELIPGLLQTQDYAREIHMSGGRLANPENAENWVQVRMERQRRLTGSPPLELRAVVSEAALGRQIASPKVMAEQLAHVVKLAQLKNVMFQVIPFSAGAHPCLSGSFTLLTFAEPADFDVGYMDNSLGGHVIEDVKDVAVLRKLFDEVRSSVLSQRDSLSLVRTITRE